jgi:hypothetical protein
MERQAESDLIERLSIAPFSSIRRGVERAVVESFTIPVRALFDDDSHRAALQAILKT